MQFAINKNSEGKGNKYLATHHVVGRAVYLPKQKPTQHRTLRIRPNCRGYLWSSLRLVSSSPSASLARTFWECVSHSFPLPPLWAGEGGDTVRMTGTKWGPGPEHREGTAAVAFGPWAPVQLPCCSGALPSHATAPGPPAQASRVSRERRRGCQACSQNSQQGAGAARAKGLEAILPLPPGRKCM